MNAAVVFRVNVLGGLKQGLSFGVDVLVLFRGFAECQHPSHPLHTYLMFYSITSYLSNERRNRCVFPVVYIKKHFAFNPDSREKTLDFITDSGSTELLRNSLNLAND